MLYQKAESKKETNILIGSNRKISSSCSHFRRLNQYLDQTIYSTGRIPFHILNIKKYIPDCTIQLYCTCTLPSNDHTIESGSQCTLFR